MTASIGLAHSIGGGERTRSVDIAPAARDGQALVAIWSGGHEDEPALIDLRTALALATRLPHICEEAVSLAADQIADS